MAGNPARLVVRGLAKRYPNGRVALKGVDLCVRDGELVVILGSNGSGKSTLLRSIVRLIEPTEGEVLIDGRSIAGLGAEELRQARMACGMIFQHANLVRRRNVLANVATGALGRHRTFGSALGLLPRCELEAAHGFLKEVGLVDFAQQRAGTLSGGQQQRVAIARALAQRPRLLLADEPVASLDPESAREIMALLRRLATEDGLAVLTVLHQPDLALAYADRVIGLKDGEVVFDGKPDAISVPMVDLLYQRQAA
ncbi:MAG TPA: phosphonate ABC transporter ATP-binding protein [Aliidongia sp.]|uniref:phosphonate ABC transporter ATP-binding protein n=1 Tax=Aliidongia sp. TaxID=1914230 RepID=UPI002DDC9F05|nr:phosphonate ABC transporter ATP-binding protein [Aliidongia sp.]HEV2677931.1 phosphonate ABC transporter ATP-binding protein [Aliidongia sp.]